MKEIKTAEQFYNDWFGVANTPEVDEDIINKRGVIWEMMDAYAKLKQIGEGSESYWKKRCEAAEDYLSTYNNVCSSSEKYQAWLKLKSSIGEETEAFPLHTPNDRREDEDELHQELVNHFKAFPNKAYLPEQLARSTKDFLIRNYTLTKNDRREEKQKEESECSSHKKEVAGISDMKVLAEMIGDLHYESLSHLLMYLSVKLGNDSQKDWIGGKEKLSEQLKIAGMKQYESSLCIRKAWQISKPFMSTESQSGNKNPETK